MTRYLILLGVTGLLALAGCRKDDVINCAPTNLPLADFSRRNSALTQTFTLALGSSQTITTAGGATLSFPANGLLLPTGGAASGTAQVRIREIYTVPDMVLANMPTNIWGGSRMLISGGEFNIQVWQNATRLRLAPGLDATLQSPIPAAQDTTRQAVWRQTAAFVGTDSTGWEPTNAPRVQTLPGVYRAALPLDSIGWWNIDQFWHAYYGTSLTQATVKTTASAFGETRVYLRPVGYNGIIQLWARNSSNTEWLNEVPVGADMIAVVLQSINGQLYYGTQRVTITNGMVITPVVSAVSEAEAVRLIRQL
jgi:hypothetical protein